MLYMSVFGFVLYLIYLIKNKKNIFENILVLFNIYFLFIFTIFTPYFKYHYYFGRYLLIEVVPSTIIIISLSVNALLKKKRSKKLGYVLVALCLASSMFYSSILFLKNSGIETNYYTQIDSQIRDSDLLFIYRGYSKEKPQKYMDNFSNFSMGTFKYFFNKNTFILDYPGQYKENTFTDLISKYSHIYLLSDREIPNSALEVKKYSFIYNNFNVAPGCTVHNYDFLDLKKVNGVNFPEKIKCLILPTHYYTWQKDFYLYKIR